MVPLLPVLSGIGSALRFPALASFLAGLAAQIFGFLATKYTKSVAINLTVIAMIIALATGFALSIKAVIAGLGYIAPPYLTQGFSYFIPDNAIPCLSAIFSARVIRWVWEWQFYVITKVSM